MAKDKKFVEEFLVAPTFDEDGVQVSSGLRADGKEMPDPVPMAPPVGYSPPPDIMQLIHSMIRNEEFRKSLAANEVETFEESDDFEFDDDDEFGETEYEKVFYPSQVAEPQKPAPPPSPVVPPAPSGVGTAEAGVASPPPSNSAIRST